MMLEPSEVQYFCCVVQLILSHSVTLEMSLWQISFLKSVMLIENTVPLHTAELNYPRFILLSVNPLGC